MKRSKTVNYMPMSKVDEYIKNSRLESEELRRKTDSEIEIIRKEAEAIRKETDVIRKESETIRKETDVIRKESETIRKETDVIRKESETIRKETDILRKENQILEKKVHDLGVNVGFSIENTVYTGLLKSMVLQNIPFDNIYKNLQYIENKKTLTEADIILVNSEYAAIIEVKHRIHQKNLEEFLTKKIPIIVRKEKVLKNKKIFYYLAGDSIDETCIETAKLKGVGVLINDSAGVIESIESSLHEQ